MTRTWWDNEAILKRFRSWLLETDNEIEAAREEAPAAGTQDSGEGLAAKHWPEADRTAAGLPGEADGAQNTRDPLPAVGLLQLVEAFTSMRHELKLSTKSNRGLEQTTQVAVDALNSAIAQVRGAEAQEDEAAVRASVPLVEALAIVDEALVRGAEAFDATHRGMTESAPERLCAVLDEDFERLSWWRRLWVRGWHRQTRVRLAEALARTTEDEFAALADGYRLILARSGRILEDHGLRRIETVGCRVDPSLMHVVELVAAPEREPETVVEDVRPGYVWAIV